MAGRREARRLRGRSNDLTLVALVGLTLAAFSAAEPAFLSLGNLLSIGQQTAVIAVVAFAMTAVILARGIDISVGSTLALAGIATGMTLEATGSVALAIPAALLVGGAVGLANGLMVSAAGISPFVATLGTMALARGAALSLSGASSIRIESPAIVWLGAAEIGGLPVSILLALLLLLAWWLLLHRTVVGRWIYAVGGNAEAARASLVPVAAVRVATYTLLGVSAGIGAIMTLGRLGSAQPLAGTGLEFAAITAAIIGGTKLSGGEGSVIGTSLGAVLIGSITTGLSFLQIPQQTIYVITGLLVLLAVLMSERGTLLAALGGGGRRRVGGVMAAAPVAGHELHLDKLGKSFPGVQALADVTFTIRSGEIVALAGENGAGKSTLVKCLSGVYQPDEGSLVLDGRPVRFASPAEAKGISVIHQHFSLAPDLTVTENLFLGREPGSFGLLGRRAMRRRARELMANLGLKLDVDARVESLTVGQRQMVEIARSMLAEAWLMIMDEPTSALSQRERDRLYGLIRRLAARGCAILYISHKMEEIFALTERTVVLRDGRFVGDRPTADLDEAALIGMMVGRDIDNVFPWRRAERGELLLEAEELSDGGVLEAATLRLHGGEIVALAGLMGSGRTELLRCLAGLAPYAAGRVLIRGTPVASGDAGRANALGVAYVPEDRHRQGIVGPMSVADNLALGSLRGRGPIGLIRPGAIGDLARRLVRSLGIRPPDPAKRVRELSGGNQQKVVIGKWLATKPRILLLDEPTRGVDVGAKSELHALIAGLKAEGVGILMASSELPEVLGVADRILVMHEGRLVGELSRGATEEAVMRLAFGRTGPVETPVRGVAA